MPVTEPRKDLSLKPAIPENPIPVAKTVTAEPEQRASRGRPYKGDNIPKFDKRLQIKLTEKGRDDLDVYVQRVGADSIGEVVRDALRVYGILTEQVFEKGNQPLIRDDNSGEILKMRLWRGLV